ncbi:glycosyltransferase family 4 protein, partial [Crocinitomix catalasitica]|nr:glycosyltransferase family 4 protein [Crocinitomix catalasitica]
DILAPDHPEIKGFFIGNGIQEKEIESLRNCQVHPFVQFSELPKFYQMADIGVWPKQESTSMLDGMASGLPIIIADTVLAIERVEGNGKMYKEDDPTDLSEKILEILESPDGYREMSNLGVEKIKSNFSWDLIALKRENDYKKALKIS